MIQIRKEENQKKQKEKKLKVYKVNTHKKTVIALWVLPSNRAANISRNCLQQQKQRAVT